MNATARNTQEVLAHNHDSATARSGNATGDSLGQATTLIATPPLHGPWPSSPALSSS